MIIRQISLVFIVGLFNFVGLADPIIAADQDKGQIAGHIIDAENRGVGGVMIVVCDQATGLPIDRQNHQPLVNFASVENILVTTSNDEGDFSFSDVADGNYRLLAQTWEDAQATSTNPLDKNGRIVRLHGIVQQVNVPSQEAEILTIKPLGSCSLEINTRPSVPNDSTLLVLSRKPMAADPILGFAGWSGSFMQDMVGWNRMLLGKTTVHGLPPGKFYLGAFANDNNPGFGGAAVDVQESQRNLVTISLIASWSNGVREPPPELRPLMRKIQQIPGSATETLIRAQHPEIIEKRDKLKDPMQQILGFWTPYLNRNVRVDDQDVLIKDLLAAQGYVWLERHAQLLLERRKEQALKKMKIDSNVTYVDAFKDLHETLESTYPCFELKQIDWEAVVERLLPKFEKVASDHEFGLLTLELVAALEDSHAQLLSAATIIPPMPLPNWDAGFACLEDDRGQAVVYFVVPGSSADAAGIKIGMTVDQIGGRDTSQVIEETMKLSSRYIGYSSSQYLRYHGFRFFTRQMQQGDFEITVTDNDGQRRNFTLTADQSPSYINRLPVSITGISDSADVSWKMLDENIGYIYVRKISTKLISKLDEAVDQLRNADGLIIDVRGNSGGGFDFNRSHRNFDSDLTVDSERPRFDKSIAVLIDSRCISAGEGWASWFLAKGRAKFFGQPTAGASARKTTYTMTNGLYYVRYPVKAYKGYLDRPIERIGLEPEVVVRQNAADLSNGRDTVLETARSYLIDSATGGHSD